MSVLRCLILENPPLDLVNDPDLKLKFKGSLPPGMCRLCNQCYCNDKEEQKDPLVAPVFALPHQLKTLPPMLILTVDKDSLNKETKDFKDELIPAAGKVTYRCFENSVHGFTLSHKPDAVEGLQMVIDHLQAYLV